MGDIIETLHPLERKVIPFLKDNITLTELCKKTKLKEVEVMRALQWLENKNILKIKKDIQEVITINPEYTKTTEKGLPEKRLLLALKKSSELNEIKKNADLDKNEFNISLGLLKRKKAISFENKRIMITKEGERLLKENFPEEDLFKKLPLNYSELNEKEKKYYNEFKNRHIILTSLRKDRYITLTDLGKKLIKKDIGKDLIDSLSPQIIKTKSWQNKKFRKYDVKLEVPKIYPGKRHFVNQATDYARKIWTEMGFEEMKGTLVNTSFWNFDALFTAQDHPVRELQDTFYIKNPKKGKLPAKKLVERIKKTHENGWKTKSTGWEYKWDEEEAKKNVLRTHTTVLSAQTLSKVNKSELPKKFFALGKCFRNETLDWSHLFEFNQTEGIVVDKDANFKHLLGYLREFFKKMGYPKIRFRPGYFPYTEPSVEGDVYDPVRKQWVELFGAGIFRPEVVVPLLGEDIPVLAWGPGFDRALTAYYNIKDLRNLYENDQKQLREIKLWLK